MVEKKYNIYIEDGVHEVKPKKKDRKDKHVRGKIVFYLKDQWSANTGRYEYIFFSRFNFDNDIFLLLVWTLPTIPRGYSFMNSFLLFGLQMSQL